MWIFRRKKPTWEPRHSVPTCPNCGSADTRLSGQPDNVRVWRGRRSSVYRCSDCGMKFYGEEPQNGIIDEITSDDPAVDDKEQLRAAEDEIRRQTEEDGDRRCW